MDNQTATESEISTPAKQQKVSKSSLIKRSLLVLLAIVLLTLAAGDSYLWQHKKLVAANTKVQQLKSTNKSLVTKLATAQSNFIQLESKYNKVKSTPTVSPVGTASAIQDDLTLTIDSAQWMNPDGTVTAGEPWFGIRMTLTNSTLSPIYVAPNNFQLEDANGNFYQEEGDSNGSTFPNGWGSSSLQAQTIVPKQTIKADIMFPMPNKNISDFTLLNGAKSYPVSAN